MRDDWGFLTSHALVLLCITANPDVRLRTVADCAGITERRAQRIVTELAEAGYLTRERLGRRTFYVVHPDEPLRNPLHEHQRIGDLLRPLIERDDEGATTAAERVERPPAKAGGVKSPA